MLERLPIESIEVSADEQFYTFEPKYGIPQGRCCGGHFNPKPSPPPPKPEFKVPLNETVMRIEDWLTRDNLSTPFCGVDRSIDMWRLGGGIYNLTVTRNTSYNVVPDTVALIDREGGDPDVIWKENDKFYSLTLKTWRWITTHGKRRALICLLPAFNCITIVEEDPKKNNAK